ncbi:pyrroloquinoline quinone biosynthesis protein PqqE [Streptomyces sp. NPDC051133]|uniref:pyrroloquinoline quinone biosynthesis protein PqqE n=1 Tax=Streptomyces sp. NPDC051133 TaxID=3155521 RepID=UPI00342EF2C9
MNPASGTGPAPPWALLAELTHACPLHCPYCSNPLELARRANELSTAQWTEVLRQAGELGVVHTHLSGGEPLLRPDLERIVSAAENAGIYTQLVTSGTGLDESRLAALAAAGLRSVQLSVQHAEPRANDRVAGRPSSFAAKERAAALVRRARLPLGLNVVLHRDNLDAVDALIELGVAWGVDRIELANAQFYGWGLLNRAALLPTRDQLTRARETVEHWRERLAGRIDLVWVVPDYFDGVAKPCMGGWGAVSLTIAPDGTALPCPAAASLPDLDAPNVRDHPLAWIWLHSPAFNRFRGTDWMAAPCRGCPRRQEDFGGCRCQAFAFTGDAARTDPACALSPDHHLVREVADGEEPNALQYIYRRPGAVTKSAPVRTAPTIATGSGRRRGA